MDMRDLRILMIDEATLLKEMERSFLKRMDIQIVLAENEREVMKKSVCEKPDIIILGGKIPSVKLLLCCKKIRIHTETGHIPILLVASESEKKFYEQEGFHHFIEKPVTQERFSKGLSKVLPFKNRACMRAPLQRKIRCCQGRSPFFELYSKDISKDGIFLKSKDPFPEGSKLIMNFTLPKQRLRMIIANGQVVRTIDDRKDSHLIAGMGLQFKKIKDKDRSLIEDYIKKCFQQRSFHSRPCL